jgi:beta-glucosidase
MRFSLPARQLSTVRADGRRVVVPGAYEISVGGKQPGFKGPLDAATTGVVTGGVQIGGPEKVLD